MLTTLCSIVTSQETTNLLDDSEILQDTTLYEEDMIDRIENRIGELEQEEENEVSKGFDADVEKLIELEIELEELEELEEILEPEDLVAVSKDDFEKEIENEIEELNELESYEESKDEDTDYNEIFEIEEEKEELEEVIEEVENSGSDVVYVEKDFAEYMKETNELKTVFSMHFSSFQDELEIDEEIVAISKDDFEKEIEKEIEEKSYEESLGEESYTDNEEETSKIAEELNALEEELKRIEYEKDIEKSNEELNEEESIEEYLSEENYTEKSEELKVIEDEQAKEEGRNFDTLSQTGINFDIDNEQQINDAKSNLNNLNGNDKDNKKNGENSFSKGWVFFMMITVIAGVFYYRKRSSKNNYRYDHLRGNAELTSLNRDNDLESNYRHKSLR